MNNQNNNNGKDKKLYRWFIVFAICMFVGLFLTMIAINGDSIVFLVLAASFAVLSSTGFVVFSFLLIHSRKSKMKTFYDKVDPERKVYSHTGNFVRTVLQVISFVVAVFGSSAIVYKINAEAVKDALLSGNTDKKVFASEGYFDVISNATGNPVLFFVFFFIIFFVLCLLIAFYDRAKLKDAEEAKKRMENRETPEK